MFGGVRSNMILWTCLGLATAVSQHVLYEYLNNRPVHNIHLPFANKTISFQQIVNAAGNTMALIVHTSFQAAICLFFVQHFWLQIRRRSFSVKQINAIVNMQKNPVSFSALRTFPSAVQLFVLALIIFSLSIISIIVPGSLTVVQGNFNEQQDCDVATVQYPYAPTLLSMDNSSTSVAGTSLPPIQKLAAKVMLLGSYLPPPTPCGTCKYDTTFNAPAIECNTTSSLDQRSLITLRQLAITSEDTSTTLSDASSSNVVQFEATLPPILDPNSQPAPDPVPPQYVVWNATYAFNTTMNLQVAWDMGDFISSNSSLTGPSGFTQCTAYNATYDVSVTQNTSESTVVVNNVVTHNQLVYPGDSSKELLSMIAIVDALASQLQGSVWLHPAGDVAPGGSIIGYGIGATSGGSNTAKTWNWTMGPTSAIPSIMQNISLSLLAGNVGALSNSSTLTTVPHESFVSTLIFQYDSIRLAGTYSSTALVTVLCVLLGFWAVKRNGSDESFDFSRWAEAVAHQDIVDKMGSDRKLEGDLSLCYEKDRLIPS